MVTDGFSLQNENTQGRGRNHIRHGPGSGDGKSRKASGIEADSGHDWVNDTSPETLQLFPGKAKKVTIKLYVPEDASPGRDPLTLTAISARDEKVSTSETVFTRILPPSPEKVKGNFYPIIPAELQLSLDRDLAGETSYGNLNLAGNGQLGNGQLNFDFGLSDLYEENALDWNELNYRSENYRINTGDVGLILSDFISKYGRGISLSAEFENLNLSLIDLSGGLKDSGGSVSYERDNLYLGFNLANLEEEEGSFSLTESLVGRVQSEGYVLEMEAGHTPSAENYGRAYSSYGQVEFETTALEGEVFFIDPDFAGNDRGDRGFRLAGTTSGENIFGEISYSHLYELPGVGAGQTRSTMKTNRLTASLRLDLLGLGGYRPERGEVRSVRFSGFAEWENRIDVHPNPATDESTRYIRGSLYYLHGNFEYSLSGTRELRRNRLAEETYGSSTVSQTFNYSFEDLSLTAGFSGSMTENLTTNELVNTSRETSFELASNGRPFVDLDFSKGEDTTYFDLTATAYPSESLEFSASMDGTIGGSSPNFGGSLDFTYDFELPLKFIITKGNIEGYVFVDENENGKKEEGEEGVSNLILNIENTTVATGKDGYFKFPPFTPGTYKLDIKNLKSKYDTITKLPINVTVKRGEKNTVRVGLRELSEIKVNLFSDENENGDRQPGEGGISGVGVTLKGEDLNKKRFTNDAGVINFWGLKPGEYTLEVDKATLPPRSEITTENAKFSLKLGGGESRKIRIGNFQRPKQIIFGQPPEADFAFLPIKPRPGERVNFSGGLSSDPDGEITGYEWDFQSDGEVDKTEKIVSYVFPEPGTYEVTLTVTDDDENEDSVTKEIEVVK